VAVYPGSGEQRECQRDESDSGSGLDLTSNSSSQPSNYNYQSWITAAQNNYNNTVDGYVTPDYSQWYVLTQVSYAGKTGSTGNQELLTYIPSSSVQQAPEPGTLLLAGFGLLIAGASRKIARIIKRG